MLRSSLISHDVSLQKTRSNPLLDGLEHFTQIILKILSRQQPDKPWKQALNGIGFDNEEAHAPMGFSIPRVPHVNSTWCIQDNQCLLCNLKK